MTIPSNTMNDTNEVNRQAALRFLGFAFGMQMDAAISMLTADATWWVIGDPSRIRIAGAKDHDKTLRMMRNMHKALPNGMRHTVSSTTAEGDRVAVEVEAEGTWQDGCAYRNNYHFLIRIKNGKVASIREYMDPTQIP